MVNGAGQIPDPRKAHIVPQINRTPARKPDFRPAPKVEAKGGHDQVTLSPKARAASAVTHQIKAVPEVRQDRVNEVRSKIVKSSGSASQNARIAEKLLTEQ